MNELRLDPDVADLPPSAKLVYLILQEAGPCTKAELRARAHLPDRTCSDAVEKLLEADLIEQTPATDARQRRYVTETARDSRE